MARGYSHSNCNRDIEMLYDPKKRMILLFALNFCLIFVHFFYFCQQHFFLHELGSYQLGFGAVRGSIQIHRLADQANLPMSVDMLCQHGTDLKWDLVPSPYYFLYNYVLLATVMEKIQKIHARCWAKLCDAHLWFFYLLCVLIARSDSYVSSGADSISFCIQKSGV